MRAKDNAIDNTSRSQSSLILGALISSIGSQCLFIVITVLMPAAGFSFFQIGLYASAGRLATLTANIFLGELSNRFSARKIVLVSEALGFAGTIGLYFSWLAGPDYFAVLLLWTAIRAFSLAVQTPSRNYLLKVWNSQNTNQQMRGAIWLNKATQGSLLFAAVLSVPIVALADIRYAIALDLISFFINGLILLFAVEEVPTSLSKESTAGYFKKFSLYFTKTPELWLLDVSLLIGVTGINTLFVKIAGGTSLLASMLHIVFGSSVWITGYLLRIPQIERVRIIPWVTIAIGFAALAMVDHSSLFAVGVSALLIFCSQWLIFHRISGQIQIQYEAHEIASVSSARMAQINIIVILGECIVGLNEKWISWSDELYIRSLFLAAIAFGLILKRVKSDLQTSG